MPWPSSHSLPIPDSQVPSDITSSGKKPNKFCWLNDTTKGKSSERFLQTLCTKAYATEAWQNDDENTESVAIC